MVRWLKLMLRLSFLGDGLFLRVLMVPLLVTRRATATAAFDIHLLHNAVDCSARSRQLCQPLKDPLYYN
jgi:hypothetical protein